jgi:hypothetical protein
MAQKRIEHAADKGGHLTLDEVAAWVQDAMRSGTAGNTPVDARVRFGGRLFQIGVGVQTARTANGDTK